MVRKGVGFGIRREGVEHIYLETNHWIHFFHPRYRTSQMIAYFTYFVTDSTHSNTFNI